MTTRTGSAAWRDASGVLLVALVATALAALPSALRFASLGGSASLGFFAYWGALALGVGAVGLIAKALGPLPLAWQSVPLGAALSVLPLVLLAQRVKAVTHHRPLGAVFFAVAAALVVAASVILARRLLIAASSRARVLSWVLAGISALGAAIALSPLARGDAGSRAHAMDGALVLGSVLATSLVRSGWAARLPAKIVVTAWVVVVGGGILAGFVLGVGAWQNAPLLSGALGGLAF